MVVTKTCPIEQLRAGVDFVVVDFSDVYRSCQLFDGNSTGPTFFISERDLTEPVLRPPSVIKAAIVTKGAGHGGKKSKQKAGAAKESKSEPDAKTPEARPEEPKQEIQANNDKKCSSPSEDRFRNKKEMMDFLRAGLGEPDSSSRSSSRSNSSYTYTDEEDVNTDEGDVSLAPDWSPAAEPEKSPPKQETDTEPKNNLGLSRSCSRSRSRSRSSSRRGFNGGGGKKVCDPVAPGTTPCPKKQPSPKTLDGKVKTQLCSFWKSSNCNRHPFCSFAHGHDELGTKTRLCEVPNRGKCKHLAVGKCKNGKNCSFRHTER